ncbi:MAG: acyl-CoA synthetase [Haloarculaceae archaeon]
MVLQTDRTWEEVYEDFEWQEAFDAFDWDAPEELNMAHEACDRWAGTGEVGLRWVDTDNEAHDYTFADLREASNRVASGLESLGVGRGDRVAVLMPKVPETLVTVLGIWKVGAVHVPLFTAFEEAALEYRIGDCEPRVVVAHDDYRDTLRGFEDDVDGLEHVVVVGADDAGGDTDYDDLTDGASPDYDVARTGVDDPSTIQYTSGTTGPPKGVVVGHDGFVTLYPFTKWALGIERGDTIWGAADPAWAYGLFTTGFGPMSVGATRVLHAGEFDANHWLDVLETHDIDVLGAAPSAYRGLMAAGEAALEGRQFDVQVLSSAGEPLNPPVVDWFEEHFDQPVYDTYGLSEAAMAIDNYPTLDFDLRKGSMGLPCPGYEVELLDPETREPVEQGEVGEIALKPRERMFIQEYWGLPEKTRAAFHRDWFLTDDLARRDEDGYFWYEGRADDVIISSGYRIGPFEVESSLMEVDFVAEAAAVGVPDEERGQRVKAYVVTTREVDEAAAREELTNHVREHLARHAYPREIEFVSELPKTATGKIQRYKLE